MPIAASTSLTASPLRDLVCQHALHAADVRGVERMAREDGLSGLTPNTWGRARSAMTSLSSGIDRGKSNARGLGNRPRSQGSRRDARSEALHVLIAGGGVAALEGMLALRHYAGDRVTIEIHAPRRDFVYRSLAVAEPFGIGCALRFDLAELARRCDARYRADGLESVDARQHQATLRGGEQINYDALLVACGAKSDWATPGAITFWGRSGLDEISNLLEELKDSTVRSVLFTMPTGFGWPLPTYELALLTSAYLAGLGIGEVELTVVTPEDAPLALFGPYASDRVASLLAERGIGVMTGKHPIRFEDGELTVVPGEAIPADRVVSMPRYEGRRIAGLHQDEMGFIATDEHSRIRDVPDAFAAGAATAFPVKQGGLATQQADAAAEAIAAAAGAHADPAPFRPILRGLLLTGGKPKFLRADLTGGSGEMSAMPEHALWWPRGKRAGKYLGPFLAAIAKEDPEPPECPLSAAIEVDAVIETQPRS